MRVERGCSCWSTRESRTSGWSCPPAYIRLLCGCAASLQGRDAIINRGGDGRLGPLLWRQPTVRLIGARFVGVFVFGANSRAEPELLAALPEMLDRIDGWIETGVLNGNELYAADFM